MRCALGIVHLLTARATLQNAANDPLIYHGRPRLRTAFEMRNATLRVQESLAEYDRPLLLLHGDADKVTAPEASQLLHDTAASTDKKICIFEGMWHALLAEPDGGADRVREEMLKWLQARI
eukprot:m.163247 g.163247  ORF g.163247 m.163247 type:complete len:121 (+) comp10307_c0_seq9:6188-6550(+)